MSLEYRKGGCINKNQDKLCATCVSYEIPVCYHCDYKPKEKEMEIIKISEEQAREMASNAPGGEITEKGILRSWKDSGYIIETPKPCPFCGSSSISYNNTGKLSCSNGSCWLRDYSMSVKDWNKRA